MFTNLLCTLYNRGHGMRKEVIENLPNQILFYYHNSAVLLKKNEIKIKAVVPFLTGFEFMCCHIFFTRDNN